MNIYNFLIPIQDSDVFLLLNTKSFIKKFQLSISLRFDDSYSKQYYFFPFTQCKCENHIANPECLQLLTNDMNLNVESIIGYSYISQREISENVHYTCYVLLFRPVKLLDLNLTNLEHRLFPFHCTDNNLFLGPEIKTAIKYYLSSCDDSSRIGSPSLRVLPLSCFDSISLKSTLDRVNQTEWMEMITKKTGHDIQRQVYAAFMNYSYPCCKMGYPQFLRFMVDQNIEKSEIPAYFRCFDVASEGFLNYHHFLIAVGCMDVNTVHGGQVGELRSRYIFSFYDEDKDGFLTTYDIRKMIIDIHKMKNKTIDEDSINEMLKVSLKVFDIKMGRLKVDLDTFLTAVGNLLFRGTSSLLRFTPDVSFSNRSQKTNSQGKEHNGSEKDVWANVEDTNCDYVLAVHSVKVHHQGTVSNIRPIWEDIKNVEQLGEFGDKCHLTFSRLHSINTFSKESYPNEIIEALTYFRYPDHSYKKPALDWGDIKMECLAKYFNIICEDIVSIVSTESRMIELKSPAYVLGDLHGNYQDLMKFEETLWRLGIGLSPGNFLFLGDYVDRGRFGIEVIAYLFAQKVLNPTQLYLLRGNHEIRSIQEQFTFKNECLTKFGVECGTSVWNNINMVFDHLPVAAVIDDKLFCVHGGIPRPSLLNVKCSEANSISSLRLAINSIPIPLSDPEIESPIAWEIMWSDPDRNTKDIGDFDLETFTDSVDFGFKFNHRRKTGYCFNQSALEGFLGQYNFSHVIRAHEVQKIGFNIELDAKLITVFSSSHYCNSANEAACVFVNQGKLRLIRLDTFDSEDI